MRQVVAPVLSLVLLSMLAACGKKDDDKKDKPAGSGDATAVLEVDGERIPYGTFGEAVAYTGQLAEKDGVFLYENGRAFKLDGKKKILVKNAQGKSSDCVAPDDYMGPSYMLMKVENGHAKILKGTDLIEVDGETIEPTPMDEFPGELDAGTYAVSLDYFSLGKACHVEGAFTLTAE